MKKQILTLIIGILIGAIITTGVFLLTKGKTENQDNRMNRRPQTNLDGNTAGGFNGGGKGHMRQNNGQNIDKNNVDVENSSETQE